MTASLQDFFHGLTIQGVTETGVEISRGAYGVVVEVKWMGLNCAVKRIHPALIPAEVKWRVGSQVLHDVVTET